MVVHTFTTLLGKTSHTTLGSVKKLGEVHNKNMDFPGDVSSKSIARESHREMVGVKVAGVVVRAWEWP